MLPLAETEATEAAVYYEEQKEGLGLGFLNELKKAKEHLSQHPQYYSYASEQKTIRSLSLNRFPYQLIFEIYDDKVVVLSVHHEKRKPLK